MRFRTSRLLALLTPIAPIAGYCLLPAGCTSPSATDTTTTEQRRVGVSPQTPTDPAQVAILHREPTRPHTKLGRVTVDAATDPPPPVGTIEANLREGAAKLGADAVVLVYDQTQTVGDIVTGDWGTWDGVSPEDIRKVKDRVIIGVAIKYR